MPQHSAGILLYRLFNNEPEFFLVHPGGPFFAKKDEGAWSIPKGIPGEHEELLNAARREFLEETGHKISTEKSIPLTPVKLKSGKIVHAWAVEGTIDPSEIKSNTFGIEWPPKSGKLKSFPEIDRGAWFSAEEAKKKINPRQVALIEEVTGVLKMNRA